MNEGDSIVAIKRMTAMLLLLVGILYMQSVAFAASPAAVYADAVSVSPGETVLIPVRIKDNPGIMGFRITVKYPGVLTKPEVTRGDITANGMLNDSITDATAGSFSVVWSGTKNMTGDGTLFTISFSAAKDAKPGRYEVGLSFSQPDTFNEKWEDVVLNCGKISVDISADGTPVQTTLPVKTAAKTAEAAREEYIADVLEKIDAKDVAAAIDRAVKEYGVMTSDEIPPEKQPEFVETVEKELTSYAPDIGSFESTGMDTEQAVEAIAELAGAAEEYATEGVNVSEKAADITEATRPASGQAIGGINKTEIIIGISLAVLAVAAVVVIIKGKNKPKNKEDKT